MPGRFHVSFREPLQLPEVQPFVLFDGIPIARRLEEQLARGRLILEW